MKGPIMRHFMQYALLLIWWGTAGALTPPLDNAPGFLSGEWAGAGEQGSYCYVKLNADGSGWVLVDGGAGDWQGARIQWRNSRQAVQVEKIVPLTASAQLRIMPLGKLSLGGGFNRSLTLSWSEQSGACQLQKIEDVARHLGAARAAIEGMSSGQRPR
jgi:hypothetical protein